jgi:formate dehydrogenase major subunit
LLALLEPINPIVDNSSRYCQNPATEGLFRTVGYGGDAGTIRDLQNP